MTEICENNEYCCGAHDVCEKGLSPRSSEQLIDYYDDDELDIFKGRTSDSYSLDEIDEFMEVLTTMYESDVSGWLQSLQLRGIELPDTVKKIIKRS